MTIYMTSDLHVDHYVSEEMNLSVFAERILKPAEILCVAGDTCDDPKMFVEFYKEASLRYKKVFVTFGNHDLTVWNRTYFRNDPFHETEKKLFFLKEQLARLGNVSLLDGKVEEYEGIRFGGCMAFNDFSYAFKIRPFPSGTMEKFLELWSHWFDCVNWNYMGNIHKDIQDVEMEKLDHVVSQKPDIIMTHYIPLFFGVERRYQNDISSTFFYFDGKKYLNQLENGTIWLSGHTHSARKKDLKLEDGRTVFLKINPVGYPEEYISNVASRDAFLLEMQR